MLDVRTLCFVLTLLTAVSAVLIYALHRYRLPEEGPRWWALSFGLVTTGLLLMGSRAIIPNFLSIVVANVLILLGWLTTLNGMRRHVGRPGLSPLEWLVSSAILLLVGAGLYWFSAMSPSLSMRMRLFSWTACAISSATTWELLTHNNGSPAIRVTSVSFLIYALFSAARALHPSVSSQYYLHAGPFNEAHLLVSILFVVGMSFGMVLMINEKLQNRLALKTAQLEENIRCRDEMEAIIRHDLKSPIAPVVTLAEVLGQEPDLPPNVTRGLDLIRQSGIKALDMVNRSLDLYKLEHGKYELDVQETDIARLLRSCAADLENTAQGHAVNLQLLFAGRTMHEVDTLLVNGDRLLLYTMIINLLRNALEAAPQETDVTADLDMHDNVIRLTITNQGEIPEKFLPRFFEKYASHGKPGGTGLGTYSAKLTAEAHNGTIAVNSHNGLTTITTALPKTA
ncbi:sensor histidine kinase [Pseudodesulfovibrio tunisiensis]|uniref:sensor histidine kinase n=1 Tax=Pseudodesulfovibrio tunisiensis TaxID=463192 RepID=UPI001FB31174|nr:HAMP domain-containing sensor histidine kinase [Pseudodesulfovibrio tunisiensis]